MARTRGPKEIMIYVRGRWEIAHAENGKWYRRDQSWICDEAGPNEIEGVAQLPPKPVGAKT